MAENNENTKTYPPELNPTNEGETTILLHLLNFHSSEIQRREQREQQLFEWCVALMLAVFGAIVALSDKDHQIAHPICVKVITSALIGSLLIGFKGKILEYNTKSIENADVIDTIENVLGLFPPENKNPEKSLQVYPKDWQKGRAVKRSERTTQKTYVNILYIIAGIVVLAVWIILPCEYTPNSNDQKSSLKQSP